MAFITLVLLFCVAGFVTPAPFTSTTPTTPVIISTSTTTVKSSAVPVASKLIASSSMQTTTSAPITTTSVSAGSALLSIIKSKSNDKSNDKSNEAIFQVATALLQKEKKWLQSEKWLIDNVYRLRNELNSLKREVAEIRHSQLPSSSSTQSSALLRSTSTQRATGDLGDSYRSEFVHDIGTLRSDHNLLAQQQQQLMQLLKDTQKQLNQAHVEQQAHQQQMMLQQKLLSPTVNNLLAYEQINSNNKPSTASSKSISSTESFKEVSSELHAIRDASATLYRDLSSLQKQVINNSNARLEATAAAKQPKV